MRICITHETAYRYESLARNLVQVLRLTPRDHDGQHVRSWRIEPTADGRLDAREDGLGNLLHVFFAEGPEDELTVRVTGEVETQETNGVLRGTVERMPEVFFLRDSPLALADDALRDFAEEACGSRASDTLDQLHRLQTAIHDTMMFGTGPTGPATTAAEAFALKAGVCQDFAHVFIAAARHREIPIRYVSGHFRRGDEVVEQGAGHAWVEARVPKLGWVGFDPTNGICSGESHVRVAVGLDYLGAAPVRGSRRGGGKESLDVRLRVAEAPRRVSDPEARADARSLWRARADALQAQS